MALADAARAHHRQVDAEHQVAQCQVKSDLEDEARAQQAAIGQQQAGGQDEEGTRQALQYGVEQGARGMPLAVLAEAAEVLGDPLLALDQGRAFPQQQATHQQQREGEQGDRQQHVAPALPVRLEHPVGGLLVGMARPVDEPLAIDGLVAADPEDVLLQGEFDGGIDARQLLLGELQADGVGQLGIHLAVELVQQADAGVDQLDQDGLVLFADGLPAVGDQVVQILALLEQLIPLLAQFKLGQVQVGDLLFQVLHQGGGGGLQLLVELIEDA
ncbi:hypothetical protein D3C76_848670 [compost metagenome]